MCSLEVRYLQVRTNDGFGSRNATRFLYWLHSCEV